ncbi:putative NADPH-quinone reductase [Rhizobium sp. BK529]|nr:putative NADPH-quinone reductase [Rhizobium sp. BK529]TCS03284.1 flavodoxin-like protein [Rhizobium sp. BK418]
MPQHILIIDAHPDGHKRHFCGALADAYAKSAADAGYILRRLDISKLDFPVLRSREAFESPSPPEGLIAAAEAVAWA